LVETAEDERCKIILSHWNNKKQLAGKKFAFRL
jgi:hypothetical protein